VTDFDDLIAEGDAVPVEGWDFSWFEGRATEERTSWNYTGRLAAVYADAQSVLDIQTGGGEVLAGVLGRVDVRPSTIAATESWLPNLRLAQRALAPFDGCVEHVPNDARLPFADATFDVVSSRHPNWMPWGEVARVLAPGGLTISQQVVPLATNRELYEFFLGQQEFEPEDGVDSIRADVAAAGLELVDLRFEKSRVEFFDIGAVVYFLRKVLWTVPDFSVDRYRDKLIELHAVIEQKGAFVSFSRHALVVATL
jgi:hypothetical protein